MELNYEIDVHIIDRYQIKRRIGKGAYGIVWRALDKKSKNEIALKKIFDAFQNRTDAQRTYREIFYLRKFTQHPNIVKLLNIHPANNSKDIYLVFEYMEIDLHKIIRKGNILKDIHKRYIIYQILKGVAYIHSANVIHRDLKPANILLNSRCICKIADFGLARSVTQCASSEQEKYDPSLTDYIATRWYRAPEILVASKKYEKGVDMWSIGCILAEMYLGKPLFPGTSTINQIELILSSVPPANNADIRAVSSGYGKMLLLENLSTVKKKFSVDKLLKDVNEEAFDLIKKFLIFNPRKRITAAQAIKHVYISLFSDDQDSLLCNCCCTVRPLLRDDVQLSVDEYRKKLFEVIKRNKCESFYRSQTTYSGGNDTNLVHIKEVKKYYKTPKDKYVLADIMDNKPKPSYYDELYNRSNADDCIFKNKTIINRSLKSAKLCNIKPIVG